MGTPVHGRADLHVHPAGDRLHGRDLDGLLAALAAADLNLVALTDHNRIDIAARLAARGAGAGIALVVGEEITTCQGHLLGLGLHGRVAPGRTLGDSIAAVHDQGGLAIVAHPLLPVTISAPRRVLEELAEGVPERRPDALESYNARAGWVPFQRRRVVAFAAHAGFPVVGGSDAHRPGDVGRGVTRFAGRTFADLRAAIAAGTTVGEARPRQRQRTQVARGSRDRGDDTQLPPERREPDRPRGRPPDWPISDG